MNVQLLSLILFMAYHQSVGPPPAALGT